MALEEILQALYAGEINLENAKKALTSGESRGEEPIPTGGFVGTGLAPVYIPTASGKKEAIAIVGMSGKYPDASNLSEYWDNLLAGKNAIREIPRSRWDSADYYDPNPERSGKIYCKWLGALDEIECFDPLFFRLTPAEAEAMDPQQRLFLEEGYKAFEDAGYSPGLLNNRKCGVYLGMMSHGYDRLQHQQKASEMRLLGSSSAIAAARLAYLLNLKGPAIAIDTACSSSLVATHLACQALWNQEIEMALVGGVTLYLTPDSYVDMCSAGMLSPDGQCKTFDASANGFVPGEGVGALGLKRLADAEADHDQIYGVIIGSGMNQDGATSGITAPSVKSQIDLLREIYEKYHIDPASISYVEMHGTGTKLGDPIELEALATVFQEKTQRKQYCAIGSVKSNIGHTSAAAGLAGVHKVLLAMQRKKLVPTLHFKEPNPHFDFADSPFYVNTEVQDWPRAAETPLRAAVSSFGFSGTNAHLVLEEYLPGRDSSECLWGKPTGYRRSVVSSLSTNIETPILFVLSAKSKQQLNSYAQEMKKWIQAHGELALSDIAFTLQVGRVALDYRLAIEASSREVLLQRLESFIDHQTSTGLYTAQVGKGTSDTILIETDDDGQSLLHSWFQKKKLAKLAQLWVRGVNVDWMLLYTVGTGSEPHTTPTLPYRISLPTYPFARKSYLLPSPKAEPMSSSKSLSPVVTAHSQSSVAASSSIPLPEVEAVDGGNGLAPRPRTGPSPVLTAPEINGKSTIDTDGVAFLQISQLEEELACSLAEALYMERSDIDVDKPFIEMGVDSILSVEWIRSINKEYASKLAATSIYDYPTIRQLAGFLHKEGLKSQQMPVQSLGDGGQGQATAPTSVSICAKPPISPTYQRVQVEGPGGIDDLIIVETDMPELRANEVRVGVRAFSLNFGDLLCVKGLYPTMPPYPFTPGFEASGIVLDVGQDVTAFKIGDPVIALVGATLGGQATVMTCLEEHVLPKPTALSFEEACALPAVATTMIAAFEKARLKPGEKILIQTATGGTGLIAIQLANYYQAEIYATAGSQPKLDYLKHLGVPYCINYQETDFEQEIARLTDGQGVDVVINTLSGDAIQKGINCLSPGGRYIEIAMTALKSARTVDLSVLSQNQTFYSIDLRKLARIDLATFKRYCDEMLRLVEEGIISPTICQVFAWENLKDAYRYMEDRQHIGKIVVRIPEAVQVNETGNETRDMGIRMHDMGIGTRDTAIAIVGMSGKYPDAKNLSEYWENLLAGRNAIREIPRSRWDSADYYDPNPGQEGKISCKWLGALDEIEYFDPLFFHISPTEAEGMDPQHRLFLEEGYKAFADAGYSPGLLSNKKCGVYLGISGHEYDLLLHQQKPAETNLLGTSSAIAAARIAYLLNLKGPAISIDTACSSSLVATHLACQALRYREIDMALVGGVSLSLTPGPYAGMCTIGMLSPDGQCKTFDASANGFVPGEGVGAVVLKRLADAEADHDQIYGVIIASGMNQDGATNGITAPSMKSQIELEREIYENYQIDPASISYVEMHGTGTQLGDPIELQALATVFQEKTQYKQYCAIGSVKTNIGHTLAAAGVAGLQKIVLAVQQKKLLPSLHFKEPNPHFDFVASPFYVNTEVQDWNTAAPGMPRRAATSSFGFSGTNAHLVIEEYIPRRDADDDRRDTPHQASTKTPYLFVLSAKSEQQLKSYAQEMMRWIQAHEELALSDIAFTLQVGRQAMEYRLAIVADAQEVLLQRLEAFVDKRVSAGVHTAQVEKKLTSDVTLFEADADGQSLLHIWCKKKNIEKVALAWVRGVNVDWKLLYTVGAGLAPALPHRISLPTSPFDRKRYWIPTPKVELTSNGTNGNGKASIIRTHAMATSRVALRSLADRPRPSSDLPGSSRSFSPSRSDDVADSSRGPVGSWKGASPVPTASGSTLQASGEIGANLIEWPNPEAAANIQAAPSVQVLEGELTRSLAKALGMEQEGDIDVEKPFGEVGLDSVIGVEWIRSLNEQYAINLTAARIYDYPSIRQMASFLAKELLKQQQTPAPSMPTLSLDDVRCVDDGDLDTSLERDQPSPPLRSPVPQADRPLKGAIAIVGMSGKYPDAKNLSEHWDNLLAGKNAIREIPRSRFNVSDYYDPNTAELGKIYCKWLGALDEIEYFDPLFFHLSPAEAEGMDPQHRLFLEEGYKAFEDAGYSPRLLSNRKCGVYLGLMSHEYGLLRHQQRTSDMSLLGSSSAIAAARLAYLLNLKGPAIAIDTACSSSLVATHLACQALWNQEIEMALVGGVTLYLTPDSYVGMCSAGMLSPDGQCKSFDASANGFVPGEGVGALVLKRLADAEADHDQIYGVIIGSGMNQDGATNGITAPSVKSQIELVREIYERYQIDPESISYVEMHGTGTKLGDPIELEALATVFQEKTQRKQYCAIGSVKSNIGHTSAAAGVASVHKVLLAMQQKKMVPSLHFQQPNEHFDFEASPFYVNTEVQDWKRASGTPRRAAVSSFGFSGTNAHLVLEEYLPGRAVNEDEHLAEYLLSPRSPIHISRDTETPCLFVLSAKSEQQLKSYAQEMKHWIQEHTELALSDIAFTLQVGRQAMEYRLAIVADAREVLLQRLESFFDNQASTEVHTGQVNRSSTGNDAALFEEDSDGQSLLHIWCQKRNLAKIAQVWARGVTVDWKLLYTAGIPLPHRVSLPTYPFVRELCWIPVTTVGTVRGSDPVPQGPRSQGGDPTSYTALHPLVQRNTSTLWQQQFSSTFRGDEFFLADHVIKGQRVLPAVAYLEMAFAAVREALGADTTPLLRQFRLSNIVWIRPLIVNSHPVTVHITLNAQESGTISFVMSEGRQEPRTLPTGEETEEHIYCQGVVELSAQIPIQRLDLPALQSHCQHRIPVSSCYQFYRKLGITYGPAFQGIEQLSVGEDEVLARLRLPVAPGTAQKGTEEARYDGACPHLLPYVLHPSMLDAALQASIGLLIEQPDQQELSLPFALSDFSIMGEVPTEGWAWISRKRGNMGESVFDIQVCDDEGHIAVHMRGLSTRQVLPGSLESRRTVLLTPSWKEETLMSSRLSEEAPPLTSSLIVLFGLPGVLASRIQAELAPGGHCQSLASSLTGQKQRFQDAVLQLIQELQNLLRERPAESLLVQVVGAHREEPSCLEALVGVLKTAQQEYLQLRGQLIEVEGEIEEGELLACLRENQQRPQEPHIRYRDGKRWVRQWREYPQVSTPTNVPWKEGGCYLITGGAGGLARLFVQEIARQVQTATVILVGRSSLSREQHAQLESIGQTRICIDYQQIDVSDGPAVHALIQRILAKSGHLDGIIHAAGVLRDSLLLNKTPEEVQGVLAPKVVGIEHLDEATSEIPLDFFVLCSSLSAVTGNVGQADYAAANAYLDAFAHARQAMVMAGERQGATVSINWPLWQAGGMQIEPSTLQMMQERLGIAAMETEVGMKILYQALTGGHAQVIVLHGQVERIKLQLQLPDSPRGAAPVERVAKPSREGEQEHGTVLTDKLLKVLLHMVSDLLKVRVEEIDAQTPLTEYGFDSITFTRFANHLNQTYQLDLTPSLFYEYSTVERLAHYLQTTFATVLAPHFAAASPLAFETEEQVSAVSAIVRQRTRVAHWLMSASEHKTTGAASAIAIIGMSGSFPQAPDVQSLWNNLLAGRDCIGEMPTSRWDWNPTTEVKQNNVKWAGVMDDVELFDPLFFGISPREAEQMDPQQRLLMMYVWKAIEDAGYSAESLSGTDTALFVGTASSGYSERVSRQMEIEGYSATGLVPSIGPNRMSYFLNLHGPSEPVETACSSSLIAIHRGVAAIESGESGMAIVGGVNTLISPELHSSFSKAGMLSEDGRCKTFSARANGYVRGEGVGMLVLKKLSLAEQDGDHIYGVIRGSAENHSGRTSSLTAPNPRAQADLLIAAYRKAGIDPHTVGYIEAHGTGTALGDPIEINGLKSAFSELERTGAGPSPNGEEVVPQAWCGIGSVKSNIGHLEMAAGVTGVIKVLLQIKHKMLVKSLHCEQVNPYIELKGSPFYIVQDNQEWEAHRDSAGNALPRRSGISSFGFGGVNAHVVLEEYVPEPRARLSGSAAQSPALIVLSARNEEQLHEQVRQLLVWVQAEMSMGELQDRHKAQSLLQDVAYTLQVGRSALEERLALQVSSLSELSEKLHRFLQEPQGAGDWYRGQVRRHKEVVELFSTEEDLQTLIDKWLQKEKYEKIMQWWVKGLKISWQHLCGEEKPRRISLPTYPFACERYWLSASTIETRRGSGSSLPTGLPLPNNASPQPSSDVAAVTSLTPILSVRLPAVEQDKPAAQGTQAAADKANGNGLTSRVGTVRIKLRPVEIKPCADSVPCDDPVPYTDLALPRTDPAPSRPSTIGTSSQAAQGTGLAQGLIPTAAPQLEEELTRSLAEALYMEESDIDVEKPFAEIGLDSVVGVEWIQSLNKQYASNLKGRDIYDYPTIRQLAYFLRKDVSKASFHRKDSYSVILAPNPSLLTGAGTRTIVLGDRSTGAVVIDPATEDPEYLSAVIQEGQKYGGIRRILITHGHPDHTGGAEALRAQLGVPILAFSHKHVPFADEEIADNALFPIGNDMLRALYTPGHSFDHICFCLEKQQILFAGDLITSSGPSLILPPPEGDLQDYIHSLERIQNLECVEIVPSHGETIFRPQETLAECIVRCQKRKQEILAAVYDAPQGIDIQTIVQVVYKNVDASLYDFLATSVLSNLAVLEREGKVKHIVENKEVGQKDYWLFVEYLSRSQGW